METNGLALVDHWDWAASKGLMNANTARVHRNACLQILSGVFPDEWQDTDVLQLDVDAVFLRFQNLRGKDLTPRSLQDYRRRFQQALDSFRTYVADPASWKAPGQERPGRSEGGGQERLRSAERKAAPRAAETQGEMVEYPFPLGEYTAHLTLPRNLRMVDAKRLSTFIASLATDWESLDDGIAGARPLLSGSLR